MGFMPVALYGLEVPCNGEIVPAVPSFPATFRVTMAAIDPSAPALGDKDTIPRATLKIIREAPIEDDESDEEDNEYMRDLMAESDDSDDEELSEAERLEKRARKENALKELMASLGAGAEDSDEDMDEAPKSKKGKKVVKKATDEDSESEEESEDDEEEEEEDFEIEEFVLCTLDPAKNYQQTLDIIVGENERVFFKVDGTHSIFLTGNYLVPDDEGNAHREVYDSDEESEEDDEDYDLSPSEDELDMGEESDDLDDLEDPRITELSEEEAPELVAKKGKNKRAAEESLDEIMEKSASKTEILSKKQQKKLKTNEGKAAAVEAKESPKDAKSVKFAKNLEQGPTGSESKKAEEKPKAALGPKIIQGVTIDDKKLGSGPAAQRGNRVSMRYIGKLKDGKVFDSNKKGKPFSFTLDKGEVIKGWDIGIKGMQVGGERRITIPADKGYGKAGVPGIPSNSTLIFDVKMLEIK